MKQVVLINGLVWLSRNGHICMINITSAKWTTKQTRQTTESIRGYHYTLAHDDVFLYNCSL